MNEVVLSASGLSKKFSIGKGSINAPKLSTIMKAFLGLPQSSLEQRHDFWALDDVSFEVRRGESLGIVGLNGAGKSTLLKIILGRLAADRGSLKVNGRVGGLIELGAGFHPEQTGRKNIYLNSKLLGASDTEIRKSIDSIIGFSEIGEFIDMPVKTYSSGMSIRLGFAIAIHFVKDLIVCDEILAVGDFEFKQKCYRKIHELKRTKSFILVSHGTNDIALFCDKALLLHKGRRISYGEVTSVLEDYARAHHDLSVDAYNRVLKERQDGMHTTRSDDNKVRSLRADKREVLGNRIFQESEESRVERFGPIFDGTSGIRDLKVYANKDLVNGELRLTNKERLEILVEFVNLAEVAHLRVGLPFFTENGLMVVGPDSRQVSTKGDSCASTGKKSFYFEFPTTPVVQGRYLVAIAINNDPGFLYRNHLVWVNVKNVTGEFGLSRPQYNVRVDIG